MRVTFYKNLSDSSHITKALDEINSTQCYIRDIGGMSILDPILTIEGPEEISKANYLYIDSFERYYFVNNVGVSVNGLYTFDCHVDVLMSWRNNILSCKGIIARQENIYNLYIDDDKFIINANRMVVSKEFPYEPPKGNEGKSFVLSIAGGGHSKTVPDLPNIGGGPF